MECFGNFFFAFTEKWGLEKNLTPKYEYLPSKYFKSCPLHLPQCENEKQTRTGNQLLWKYKVEKVNKNNDKELTTKACTWVGLSRFPTVRECTTYYLLLQVG